MYRGMRWLLRGFGNCLFLIKCLLNVCDTMMIVVYMTRLGYNLELVFGISTYAGMRSRNPQISAPIWDIQSIYDISTSQNCALI